MCRRIDVFLQQFSASHQSDRPYWFEESKVNSKQTSATAFVQCAEKSEIRKSWKNEMALLRDDVIIICQESFSSATVQIYKNHLLFCFLAMNTGFSKSNTVGSPNKATRNFLEIGSDKASSPTIC